MQLKFDTLILGAGYSGLIYNYRLKLNKKSNVVIVERGYNHGYTGDDYVIFTKDEHPFTDSSIEVLVSKISSGNAPFDIEYTKKVYNRIKKISTFDKDNNYITGYPINSEMLLKHANIYGNIEITKIDIKNHTVYGKILHLNEDVAIFYKKLVNTFPIHKFAKLADIDLLKTFGLFISYFPIGIKRRTSMETYDNMILEYVSDENIPYYRKQYYKNTIYYEYCINKKLNEKFDSVIIPGKFNNVNERILKEYHDMMLMNYKILNVGRYAKWNADYQLDDIMKEDII